jgi:hypothetical protein
MLPTHASHPTHFFERAFELGCESINPPIKRAQTSVRRCAGSGRCILSEITASATAQKATQVSRTARHGGWVDNNKGNMVGL